jgi:hypothetical protein
MATIESEEMVAALREAIFRYETKRQDLEDKFGAALAALLAVQVADHASAVEYIFDQGHGVEADNESCSTCYCGDYRVGGRRSCRRRQMPAGR